MADYRTGGTPWMVIIGPWPDRIVRFDGFRVSPDTAFATIKRILALTS
jgi:hypothetical protein